MIWRAISAWPYDEAAPHELVDAELEVRLMRGGGTGEAEQEVDGGALAAELSRRLAGRWQGLTLVHFSAQRKHVLWDTLCLRARSMTRNGSG
jgi:hypothetical protein